MTIIQSDSERLPVAVVIAAHNRAEWVVQAVRSALAQRPHPPAEVIVVDDASTDDTAAAAASAGARVIRHEENRGAAAARNTGAGATEQPWIAPLDSDDRWLPHMLSTLWPLRDSYGFVAGASLAVKDNDEPVSYGGTLAPEPIVLSSPAPLIYPENFIAASGVIIRRETFFQAGGYRASQRRSEDFDLWMRMLLIRPGLCVPRVVTLYRIHETQKAPRGSASRDVIREIVERYWDGTWYRGELLESREAVLAWDAMREAWAGRRLRRVIGHGCWITVSPRRRQAVLTALARRREGRRRASRASSELELGGPTAAPEPLAKQYLQAKQARRIAD